jgi:hypothetical protein
MRPVDAILGTAVTPAASSLSRNCRVVGRPFIALATSSWSMSRAGLVSVRNAISISAFLSEDFSGITSLPSAL